MYIFKWLNLQNLFANKFYILNVVFLFKKSEQNKINTFILINEGIKSREREKWYILHLQQNTDYPAVFSAVVCN